MKYSISTSRGIGRLLVAVLLLSASWAQAKEVSIAIGLSIPPYVLKESNQGIELEIMAATFASQGHTLKPKYLGGKGMWNNLKAKRVAGAVMNSSYDAKRNLDVEVYYSDNTLSYQNYAIALADSNLSINAIADLKDKRVVAFFNASKVLGADFSQMAKANQSYVEKPKQLAQVIELFSGRTDVVVADRKIFEFFRKKAQGKVDVSKELQFFQIFQPSPRRVMFLSREDRDAFNQGLKAIQADGTYERIVAKYQAQSQL